MYIYIYIYYIMYVRTCVAFIYRLYFEYGLLLNMQGVALLVPRGAQKNWAPATRFDTLMNRRKVDPQDQCYENQMQTVKSSFDGALKHSAIQEYEDRVPRICLPHRELFWGPGSCGAQLLSNVLTFLIFAEITVEGPEHELWSYGSGSRLPDGSVRASSWHPGVPEPGSWKNSERNKLKSVAHNIWANWRLEYGKHGNVETWTHATIIN